MFKRIVLTALLVVSSGASKAALVEWHPTFDTTGASDVVTLGETVEAFNFSSDGTLYEEPRSQDTEINGITFLESTDTFDLDAGERSFLETDVTGATSGDVDYDMLLDTLDYGGGKDSVSFYAGDGYLVEGNTYLVQFWYADIREDLTGSRIMRVGDGYASDALLHNYGEGLGQYIIGTFVADSDSQYFEFQVETNFGNAHLNAYQLRDVTGESTFNLAEGRNLAEVPAPLVPSLACFILMLIRRGERSLA